MFDQTMCQHRYQMRKINLPGIMSSRFSRHVPRLERGWSNSRLISNFICDDCINIFENYAVNNHQYFEKFNSALSDAASSLHLNRLALESNNAVFKDFCHNMKNNELNINCDMINSKLNKLEKLY